MDIIPPIILELIQLYRESLDFWFSQRLYERLLPGLRQELLVRVQALVDFAPLEQACAAYYHQAGPGDKPDFAVSILVRAVLARYLFQWSYQTTERQMRTNLVLKWFVGLTVDGAVPDHTTLFRFESWLGQEQPRLYFDALLKQIDAALPNERGKPQITDTFAMRANAAEEGLTRKLRHTCRILLRELQKGYPEGHAQLETALPANPLVWQV